MLQLEPLIVARVRQRPAIAHEDPRAAAGGVAVGVEFARADHDDVAVRRERRSEFQSRRSGDRNERREFVPAVGEFGEDVHCSRLVGARLGDEQDVVVAHHLHAEVVVGVARGLLQLGAEALGRCGRASAQNAMDARTGRDVMGCSSMNSRAERGESQDARRTTTEAPVPAR